ncbi:MAG: 3-deoxy-8-phosphooctulonate synthase [Arenicellales bacterium]|nr:3-deoxy-8-phosphooctulonate synthase [Arenicellales bacterium]
MKLCGMDIGLTRPIFLIAGPCVIESQQFAIDTAATIQEIAQRLNILFVYKSSYDKANRSSIRSYRGPGMDEGLSVLAEVKRQIGCAVLTDVHSPEQVDTVASVADVLQTPAFLCRQTDLICAVAKTGKPVNIKKGQFLSPHEMINVVEKAKAAAEGEDRVMVCERGVSFGYNNLVVDMRSLAALRQTHCPVVFDVSHSVQLPGGQQDRSGGERKYIPVLARAAVAAGIAGLFVETHPDPDNAPSDGPNAWPLDLLEQLLSELMQIDSVVKQQTWLGQGQDNSKVEHL